jgi:MFS family permease
MILGIIAVGALLNAGVNAPLLNASFFQISLDSNTPISKVARTSSWQFLATACIGPFLAAMAVKYGKRPVFLLSGLFNIIGTAVGESGESYHHLLVARIIQGLAIAAYESLNFSIVGDLFFVHQRGLRVSISNFMVTALSNLAGIISGQVFQSLGWAWVFHLYQIFLVIHFLLLFFLVPETTFNRDSRYNIDTVEEDILPELAQKEQEHVEHVAEIGAGEQEAEIPKKKTYFQELAVFTGTYTDVNILKLILEPFVTMVNPASLYIGLGSGWVVAW